MKSARQTMEQKENDENIKEVIAGKRGSKVEP